MADGTNRPDRRPTFATVPEPGDPLAQLLNTLTADEAAQLNTARAGLRESRYVDIEQHGKLRPGVRVRHRGHQWPGAAENGTGAVLVLVERPNSAWSQSWGAADVEMIVLWDTAQFTSRLSQLAQYHVHVAEVQP